MSHTSLPYDASLDIEPKETVRAVFFGFGSDGTVGANKNTIKILGDAANLHAQGYFVYDSKKSGSQTVSHLRFGPRSIRAPYLVSAATFVGCHQFGLIERSEVLERAAHGATLLLNCPYEPDRVWDALSRPVQEKIIAKEIELYAIDAGQDRARGRTGRADQHGAADVLLRDLGRDGAASRRSRRSRPRSRRPTGSAVTRSSGATSQAVDRSLAALHRVSIPDRVSSTEEGPSSCPRTLPRSYAR